MKETKRWRPYELFFYNFFNVSMFPCPHESYERYDLLVADISWLCDNCRTFTNSKSKTWIRTGQTLVKDQTKDQIKDKV